MKKKIRAALRLWYKPQRLMVALLVLTGIFILLLAVFPNNQVPPKEAEEVRDFSGNWILQSTGEEVILPCVIESTADEIVEITKIIPESRDDFHIAFISSWQSVRIFAEDTLLYDYYTDEGRFFDTPPPPKLHIVPIPQEMQGRILKISFQSPMDQYSGVLNGITAGSKYDLVSEQVGPSISAFLLCFIIFLAGIFTVILCIFLYKEVNYSGNLLYLGTFSILLAIWSAFETRIVQFVISDQLLTIFITLLCVMLLPIPLLLFFRSSYRGRIRQAYNAFIYFHIGYFILRVFLQIANLVPLSMYYRYYTIILGITLVWITVSTVWLYLKQRKREQLLSMLAVSFFLFFSAIDIARAVIGKLLLTNNKDAFSFFRIGIILFIVILAYSIMEEITAYYQESIKAAAYKDLAYTDSLSQLNNRTYLMEIYPSLFEEAVKKKNRMGVIMLDIDNFKAYNDNYGHLLGDMVIFEIAKVIREKVRHPLDAVIRYGGEEFLVILPYQEEEETHVVAEEIKKGIFELRLAHSYSETAAVITISQGVFCDVPAEGEILEDFIQKADEALYQAKREGKNRIITYLRGK